MQVCIDLIGFVDSVDSGMNAVSTTTLLEEKQIT
jgi:hypothetical protein